LYCIADYVWQLYQLKRYLSIFLILSLLIILSVWHPSFIVNLVVFNVNINYCLLYNIENCLLMNLWLKVSGCFNFDLKTVWRNQHLLLSISNFINSVHCAVNLKYASSQTGQNTMRLNNFRLKYWLNFKHI